MNITGGKYNSRKIKAPNSDFVRPTLSKIRESVFNILNSRVNFSSSRFLDLFSGSGIMSLEAVSRGFKEVISVEKDCKTAKIIKENFAQLDLTPNLIIKDALIALESMGNPFNAVYIDPPYSAVELYSKVLFKIAQKNLLTKNGIIITDNIII